MKLELEDNEAYLIILGMPALIALTILGTWCLVTMSMDIGRNQAVKAAKTAGAQAEMQLKVNPVTEGVDLPITVTTNFDVISLPVTAEYTSKAIKVPVEVELPSTPPTIMVPVRVNVDKVQAAETKQANPAKAKRTLPNVERDKPEFDPSLPPPRDIKKESE